MKRSVCSAVILCVVVTLSASAFATSGEILTFQGLADLTPVGSFYNGGGLPSTPNYGVTFSSNFVGIRPSSTGGSGNFAAPPVGGAAIFISGATGSPAVGTMNVAPGFSNGINFFFTAGFTGGQTATVTIWSGADGTGTVLATLSLANNNTSCNPAGYCVWTGMGMTFSGTAHSVTFNGPADELGLADITVGSSRTAIPEPSSVYLLGTGLVGVSLRGLRKRLSL